MSLLQPYIDRLKTNKYLGGDSLSYSDCFFSQQMCSIGVFVKVLKGSDMMESIPELSSYLKRLKMRDSWKFVRGAWEIRHTEDDVRLVEYEFGKMFLHYAINRWGLQMANYDRVTSFTNEAISSTKQFNHPSSTWGSTISVQDVPKYEKDHLILVTGGIYVSSGELVKVCPYSSTVEMVLMGMKVAYKVICVDFTAKKKDDWFVDIHKDG